MAERHPRGITLSALALTLFVSAAAQRPPAPPHFAVVSIKPNAPGSRPPRTVFRWGSPPPSPVFPGGKYIDHRANLWSLIAFAYPQSSLRPDQTLLKLPTWALGPESFDFEAESAPGATPDRDQMRLMMRAALAVRFKFTFHTESRVMPVYFLEVAKRGPTKLAISSPDEQRTDLLLALSADHLAILGRAVSMQELAGRLGVFPLDRPVLDRTGLARYYDINVKPSNAGPPPPGTPQDSRGATLRALAQLGLTLVSGRAPVPVMVVDHVERPSPN